MSYRAAQWCLLAAFLAHNVEEGMTIGGYLPASQSVAARILGTTNPVVQLTPASFGWALVVVSAAGGILVGLGRRRPDLPILLAAVMLVNVFIPHLPAALVLGGYSPGLVTSVVVNLPVSIWFLRRSLGDGHAPLRHVVAAVAAAPLVIVGSIAIALALTSAAAAALR